MRRVRILAAALLVAIASIAARCGGVSHPTVAAPPRPGATSPSTAVPGAAGRPYWLITNGALRSLGPAGLSLHAVATLFDSPQTLLINKRGRTDPLVPAASLVESFTDFASLQRALVSGQVPPSVSYVLLDLEHWQYTPVAEQVRPFQDAQNARRLAHRFGRKLIFAPAVNLAPLQPGTRSGDRFQQFLNLDFAGQGAAVSDVFEIQAQQTEGTSEATTFAIAAVKQAKAAATPVLVGIGTNPAGRTVTAQDIAVVADSVRAVADGYWLNIPQAGANCPTCGTPQPAVAVQFLQQHFG